MDAMSAADYPGIWNPIEDIHLEVRKRLVMKFDPIPGHIIQGWRQSEFLRSGNIGGSHNVSGLNDQIPNPFEGLGFHLKGRG